MDVATQRGSRIPFSRLDYAGLKDIGWTVFPPVLEGWTSQTAPASLLVSAGSGSSLITVGNFPGYGVWKFTPAGGWQNIAAEASALAVAPNGVIALYSPGYLGSDGQHHVQRYTPGSGWVDLPASAPVNLLGVASDGTAVANMPGYGVYKYTTATGYTSIAAEATALAVDATGNIVISTPSTNPSINGTWRYSVTSNSWVRVSALPATLVAISSDLTVYASFGTNGVWRI
ncbi:hypothetical protein J0H58_35110 [bacterium]|nr:hypothetical protein [bacterium]